MESEKEKIKTLLEKKKEAEERKACVAAFRTVTERELNDDWAEVVSWDDSENAV